MRKRAALRTVVARTRRRAFPDGVIDQPYDEEEDSGPEDLQPKLWRRLARLPRGAALCGL